jgi:hypothetical protein
VAHFDSTGIMSVEDAREVYDACLADDETECMLSVDHTTNPWEVEVFIRTLEGETL